MMTSHKKDTLRKVMDVSKTLTASDGANGTLTNQHRLYMSTAVSHGASITRVSIGPLLGFPNSREMKTQLDSMAVKAKTVYVDVW